MVALGGHHTRHKGTKIDCFGCCKPQEYMVPWMGGSIPESTHDKYWESAFYNRLLVRVLYYMKGGCVTCCQGI